MKRILLFLSLPLLLVSCITEDVLENSPQGNFDALWRTLDQRYCFFDYKAKEYGLNWDEVYNRYQKVVKPNLKSEDLFDICRSMLRELRDGHVNLTAAHDVARYWDWFEKYPANFSDSLQRPYLGTDYHIGSGIKYKILNDNIGYIYCETFNNGFGSGNLSEMLRYFAITDGLIIDVRNNAGGMITSAQDLAGCFTNEKRIGAYICHKTGKGHNDFSEPTPIYIDPAKGLIWQKKVVVLTNRRCYSAANAFVMFMKACPNVKIVGDRTGGGSGLPLNSELPNGWHIRFSACPMFDKDKNQTEMGIDPDLKVDITSQDYEKGIDTIIEAARTLLKKKAEKSLEE
ncbi:MAG: S41 family peptidase [Bacteroidaceae bacterium]